jgi:vancomycin resistance protein VanJ
VWRRGLVPATLAVLTGVLLACHADVPNAVGNLGSLLETFLPWVGLAVPVLLACALWRRSASALVALLVPVVVWADLFGGLIGSKAASGGDLTVLTHNVDAGNPRPAATAADVARAGAGLIALEELTATALPVYEHALAARYPYHAVEGTVGLWSRYPLSGTEPVDIKLGWVRALRTTVATPQGRVAVYVAHLPSVRVRLDGGFTADQRDASATALGDAIAEDPLPRVILLGDLNGTMNDRSLSPITAQMRSAQGAAGDGFGFSWPAAFPMARIDQIMVKGIDPTRSWVLPATGSDHRPVAATLDLADGEH